MFYKKFEIDVSGQVAALEFYAPLVNQPLNEKKRPTVIVIPGGAYYFVSPSEADPIAVGYLNEGMNCAVLTYSVAPTAVFPTALVQLAKSVLLLRENATDFGIDKDKIFVCGFSAGGHLAASLSVHWKKTFLKDIMKTDCEKYKPNGAVLCYPVTANYSNVGSFKNLLGDKYGDSELMELTDITKQVDDDTVPMFIFHTYQDKSVPVEATLELAVSLRKHNIPFDLHIYEKGVHGISRASRITENESRAFGWLKLSADWMFEDRL